VPVLTDAVRTHEDAYVSLLTEGFDMLDEDLDEERFFALAGRTYWSAPEGSSTRALTQTLTAELDF
jgi:hypothetical protein